jgi:hypothetical protein
MLARWRNPSPAKRVAIVDRVAGSWSQRICPLSRRLPATLIAIWSEAVTMGIVIFQGSDMDEFNPSKPRNTMSNGQSDPRPCREWS